MPDRTGRTEPSRRVSGPARRARQMLLGGLAAGHVVGAVILVIAVLTAGRSAIFSVALGFGMVVVFFTLGQMIEVVAGELDPVQGMVLVLASYALRVIGITAALWWLLGHPSVAPLVDGHWLAASVTATVIGWISGVVLVASRQRVPIYDRDDT